MVLVRLRVVDKAFSYADSGLSASAIQELTVTTSFLEDYKNLLLTIILLREGKTESGENVIDHLTDRLVPTLQISFLAILFGVVFSIIMSLNFLEYPRTSALIDSISKIILSTPIFIFSLFVLILFFYKWEILPPGGYRAGEISYLILPSLSLGVRVYARLQLYLSTESRVEWESPFFKLLKTRGIPIRLILYNNLFPKLFPTFLVLVILDLGSLLSGAMVVEEIFFFPGIGRSLFYSIKSMDRELLSVLLVYSGVMVYLMNRIGFIYQESKRKIFLGESNQ
jgi:peptide/nickel transport system permease protein